MTNNQPYHKLPLEGFIERLRQADFYISPEQHMQFLKVLDAFGTDDLHRLAQLKYRLSPIIAKSKEEQQLVYDLWDSYLEGIVPPPPIEEPLKWWQKLKVWQLWLILGTITALLAFFIAKGNQVQQPEIVIQFDHPSKLRMQDSIHFKNTSLNIDSTFRFDWEWQDAQTNEPEHTAEGSFHWSHRVTSFGRSSRKRIILKAYGPLGRELGRDTSTLEVLCARLPGINRILAPDYAQIDEEVQFRVDEDATESGGLQYQWDFGDEATDSIPNPIHRFSEAGAFTVKIVVARPKAKGPCQVTKSHRITIGQEKAYLAEEPLLWDEGQITITFGWGMWLLLSLLGGFMLYNWYRWLRQKPPVPEAEQDAIPKSVQREPSDKGPYYIPFVPNNHLIEANAGLFRLADVLRQRQEGIRKLIDIPATVHQTVEKGGFPSFQYRSTTRPPEYLFLIDEQGRGSHQASLFAFLAEFLQNKDVYISLFWYNTDLTRFWNEQHPKGMNLEDLYRLYPRHRLLVMGDAHSLIDQHAEGKPALKARIASDIRHWDNRLLLTPKSVASWTYREQVLYQLFTLFPSNMNGFRGAMAYLETDREEEDEKYRVRYDDWVATHSDPPVFPNTNYVKWRDFKSYQTYFSEYKEVYRWLCALAVYPTPTWEISLAIGRAIDAPVTLENLLLLSQVPWLQGQSFSPRLRQKLLAELDETTIVAARKAVKKTLEKGVNPIVAGSHADLDFQRDLAIQNILIDPNDPTYRKEIQALHDKGWLSKKQHMDIKAGLQKSTATSSQTLEQLLAEGTGEAPPLTPPKLKRELDHHFFRGLAAAALLLLLGALIWTTGGQQQIHDLVFGERDSRITQTDSLTLRDYLLVKETWDVDSAVLYNQQGYALWYQDDSEETVQQRLNRKSRASTYFSRAVNFRNGDYPVAQQNTQLATFNLVVENYNQYLETFDRTTWLSRAKLMLDVGTGAALGTNDLGLKQRHLSGLINFYDEKTRQARVIAKNLLADTDSLFFDTLSTYPHLHSLLNPELYDLESITSIQDPKCYVVNDSVTALQLFVRPQLSLKEEITNPDDPGFGPRIQSASSQDQGFTRLVPGTRVQKLGESTNFFQIRVGDKVGYILKDIDVPTLQDCAVGADLEYSPNWQKPLIADFGPPIAEPGFMWFLDNFHGALTPGKRSPVLPDGRQFFEYEFTRDIVRRMVERLDQLGVQYHVVVPEVEVDNMLEERARRVNEYQTNLTKAYIAVNCNAGPAAAGQWTNDATNGVEVWFLHNSDGGQIMANTFQQQLIVATGWKDRKIRSKPNNQFYALRNTEAIAILTENGFYNNRNQVVELLTDSTRQKIADAHVRAILEMERSGLGNVASQEQQTADNNTNNSLSDQRAKKVQEIINAFDTDNRSAVEVLFKKYYDRDPSILQDLLDYSTTNFTQLGLENYNLLILLLDNISPGDLKPHKQKVKALMDAGAKAEINGPFAAEKCASLAKKLGLPNIYVPVRDSDQDNIPNSEDQCPTEAGTLPNGCSDRIEFVVVEEASDEPLAGASVVLVLQGTRSGTITDIDGKATLYLTASDANKKLQFNFVGYNTIELTLQEIVDRDYSIAMSSVQVTDPSQNAANQDSDGDDSSKGKNEFLDIPPFSLYFDNDQPDPRSRKPTTSKHYIELYEAYFSKQEIYIKEGTKGSSGKDSFLLRQRYENFFKRELRGGKEDFVTFLEFLEQRLIKGQSISFEIKGFSSPLSQSDYNEYLSSRRIASVINTIKKHNDGVLDKYISNGSLRIVTSAVGEKHTPSSVSNQLLDSKNSVYSILSMIERRVEISNLVETTPKKTINKK